MEQSYLPDVYCWPGRKRYCQVATEIRDTLIIPFLSHVAARGVLAYSGHRTTDVARDSDHLCGFALDLVPKAGATLTGRAQLWAAYLYAKTRRYPYVEWVWQSGNHHLHVSFRRCSK